MIKRTYRAHPLMMTGALKPLLFVLILPVIKGVLQYLTTGKMTGVLTFETVAAATVLVLSYLSYRAFSISVDGEKTVIRKGFFLQRVSVIKNGRISCVSVKKSIPDLLFGSVTYIVNTEAGASGKPDFSFKLYQKDAREVLKALYGEENRAAIRFGTLKSAVFAAATSSAVSGLAVGVPIINNLGKILGVALSGILLGGISQASARFNKYFPPIVNVATALIVLGYMMSFLIGFVRLLGFRLLVGDVNIEVRYGLVARRRTVFKKTAVNDVCIEQTPLMRAFGMCSVRAAVGGYGDKKGEKAIIVPAARREAAKDTLEMIFPALCSLPASICPERSKTVKRRFLLPARIYALADIAATAALSAAFPSVARFLILCGAAIMAATVYYGNLCLKNYLAGGLCVSGNVSARGSSGFTVREMYCEKDRVGEIKIRRTPADRAFGTCKVKITVRSESADSITVRNVGYAETLGKIEKTFNVSE